MVSTIRTIDSIDLIYIESMNAYRIEIRGKSFLHHMIRRIVGACLEVASRTNAPLDILTEAIAAKNPEQSLPNASPEGLCLYKIFYYD
jgi:tRNA pseudouridine(38-40) synthase